MYGYKTELTTANVTKVIDFLLENAIIPSDVYGIAIFRLAVLNDVAMNTASEICKEINGSREDVAVIASSMWYDDGIEGSDTWFLDIF